MSWKHSSRTLPHGHKCLSSEPVIVKVTIYVLEAVVPIKNQVAPTQAPQPLHTEVHNLLKVSRKVSVRTLTYLFPVGTLRGFTSALLKWAKTSSQGAAL